MLWVVLEQLVFIENEAKLSNLTESSFDWAIQVDGQDRIIIDSIFSSLGKSSPDSILLEKILHTILILDAAAANQKEQKAKETEA